MSIERPKIINKLPFPWHSQLLYRDVWLHSGEVLALSATLSFLVDSSMLEALPPSKTFLSNEVFLTYPNLNKPFDIHTDAGDVQIGSVVFQTGHSIAPFLIHNQMTDAPTRSSATDRELLAIVEPLIRIQNYSIGHPKYVCTDHQNLTYKQTTNFHTPCRLCWRLPTNSTK